MSDAGMRSTATPWLASQRSRASSLLRAASFQWVAPSTSIASRAEGQ